MPVYQKYYIMQIMSLPPFSAAFLYNQPHIFHTSAVFIAGGDDINSGGINAAMAKKVGQLGKVLLNAIKGSGEQMP